MQDKESRDGGMLDGFPHKVSCRQDAKEVGRLCEAVALEIERDAEVGGDEESPKWREGGADEFRMGHQLEEQQRLEEQERQVPGAEWRDLVTVVFGGAHVSGRNRERPLRRPSRAHPEDPELGEDAALLLGGEREHVAPMMEVGPERVP